MNSGILEAESLSRVYHPGTSSEVRALNGVSLVIPGGGYVVLAGRVDPDGNMVAGVRHPNLSVPIGTFTGWNLRREGFAEGAQCAGAGSFIPFASNNAERQESGDPRLSIEERYRTHDAYVSAVSQAADRLVQDRLLLQRDAEAIVERAEGSTVGRSN